MKRPKTNEALLADVEDLLGDDHYPVEEVFYDDNTKNGEDEADCDASTEFRKI